MTAPRLGLALATTLLLACGDDGASSTGGAGGDGATSGVPTAAGSDLCQGGSTSCDDADDCRRFRCTCGTGAQVSGSECRSNTCLDPATFCEESCASFQGVASVEDETCGTTSAATGGEGGGASTSTGTSSSTGAGAGVPASPEPTWAISIPAFESFFVGQLVIADGDLVFLSTSTIDRVSPDGVVLGSLPALGASRFDVAPDGDVVSIHVDFSDPAWITRRAPDGAERWRIDLAEEVTMRAADVAVGPDGTIGFTSQVDGAIDLGEGPLDPIGAEDRVVALLDPDGAVVWSMRFPGEDAVFTTSSVAFEPGGDFLFTGCTAGEVDFGGGPIAGTCFVVRVGPGGEHVFTAEVGGTVHARDLEVTADGDLLLLLAPPPPGGELVQRVAADGTLGVTTFLDHIPYAIAPTADGGFVVAGSTEGVGATRSGVIGRHDANGELVWEGVWGTPEQANDRASAAEVLPGGDVVVGGVFARELAFGAITLTAEDDAAFLARFPLEP